MYFSLLIYDFQVDKPISPCTKSAEKPATFGGMKKGFLFGGSSKSPDKHLSKNTQQSTDHTLLIKPKDPESKDRQHEIPEVQQAMNASQSFLQNKGRGSIYLGDIFSCAANSAMGFCCNILRGT